MLNRIKVWLISLWVLAGTSTGFAAFSETAGEAFLGGLAGGFAASVMLASALRLLPLKHAWEHLALHLGVGLAVISVLLSFWMVPLLRNGWSINAEPLSLDIAHLDPRTFATPRYVLLKGRLDDTLAVERRFDVMTRSSNKSSFQSESRRTCRSPFLSNGNRVSVVTDLCAPFSPRSGSYQTLLSGILYPVCRDESRDCHDGWSMYIGAKSDRLGQLGYRLNETDGWILRVGESPGRTYWGLPLALTASALLLWTVMIFRIARFGNPPELRRQKQCQSATSMDYREVDRQATTSGAPEISSNPMQIPVGSEDTAPALPGDDKSSLPLSNPEARFYAALANDPATCETLDLCADWDSYKSETPLAELSPQIKEFARLKSLNLMWNELHHLPNAFSSLDKLEELNLTCNPLGCCYALKIDHQ